MALFETLTIALVLTWLPLRGLWLVLHLPPLLYLSMARRRISSQQLGASDRVAPYPPLLFIFVIEGLSLLIADARDHGLIKGIKITSSLALTHLLFVDDVILLGTGTLSEWMAFDVILGTFCKALGMCISIDKSCFLHNNVDVDIRTDISRALPYKMEPLTTGFKYLGYYLKPLGYKVSDWN